MVEEDASLSAELRDVHLKELRKNEESFGMLFNEEKYEERRERGDVRFTYRAMQVRNTKKIGNKNERTKSEERKQNNISVGCPLHLFVQKRTHLSYAPSPPDFADGH